MATMQTTRAQVMLKPQQAPGLVFGLQQPALAGDLRLWGASHQMVEALHQRLASVWAPSRPMDLPGARPGLRLAVSFANWVAEVQRQLGFPISDRFYLQQKTRGSDGCEVFGFALPYDAPQACADSIAWVVQHICYRSGEAQAPVDAPAHAETLATKLRPLRAPGINDYGLVDAACRLDIPFMRLRRGVLLLGTGKYQRCIQSTLLDTTSAIGVKTAHDKFETARWLRLAGLPGAENLQVRSEDDAVSAAGQLGYPVVVKPADQEQGRGVAADLRDPTAVRAAYATALGHSRHVLVEKWVPGFTHRLTVLRDQVVRVNRRLAGGVTGDGVHTIEELLIAAQKTPRQQRLAMQYGRPVLVLDDEALGLLQQSGLSAQHVPAAGVYVRLRRRDNVNAGGETEIVDMDRVHPDNLRVARDAARLLRLDFAGIDLIIDDIGRSWQEGTALICEVNAQPQLGASAVPDLYVRIVDELMAAGHRVPVELFVTPSEPQAGERLMQKLLNDERGAGVSHPLGLYVAGTRVGGPFADGFSAARALLMRDDVERAICLMSPLDILRFGNPVNQWDAVRWPDSSLFSAKERAMGAAVEAMVTRAGGDAAAPTPASQVASGHDELKGLR